MAEIEGERLIGGEHLFEEARFRLVFDVADGERANADGIAARERSTVHEQFKAFDASARTNAGHALETAVLNELERRGAEVGYVKGPEGVEVDFLARWPSSREELIQVCADASAAETRAREIRALTMAAKEHPRAKLRLLVLDRDARVLADSSDIEVTPAYEWLLAAPGQD